MVIVLNTTLSSQESLTLNGRIQSKAIAVEVDGALRTLF